MGFGYNRVYMQRLALHELKTTALGRGIGLGDQEKRSIVAAANGKINFFPVTVSIL